MPVDLIPQRPGRDAPRLEQLIYVRHWNILATVVSIPVWVLVLAIVESGVAVVAFVAVGCFTTINLGVLQWRIARERRA